MPVLTEILKPEKFNSTEIAQRLWDAFEPYATAPGQKVRPWTDLNEPSRQLWIDAVQQVLDRLREEGVIR